MMKKFVALFFFFFLIFILFIGSGEYKNLIYPPLHRDIASPRQLIPEAATSSIEIIEHGDRSKALIALTFDADMTPGMRLLLKTGAVKSLYNAKIKEILDSNDVPATIFLGGLWTQTYPNEAKALAADPLIEIGNHSYNHYAFANSCYGLPILGSNQIDDVALAQKTIKEITGVTPKYFRFPGGCYQTVSLETVASLGLTVVHWDVASEDGFNNNTDSIVRGAESKVQNGSILVFHLHDNSYAPKTADALQKIIPDLKMRGFKFVTISELISNN